MVLRFGNDRRRHLRVPLRGLACVFRLTAVNGSVVASHPGRGLIQNLSVGGLCFQCDVDLPVRRNLVCEFRFRLQGLDFVFRGRLLRKLDTRFEYIYGVEFVQVEDSERQRLAAVLAQRAEGAASLPVPGTALPPGPTVWH